MIKKEIISEVLLSGLSTGADFAELYCEDVRTNSVSVLDRRVHRINSGRSFGVGIRLYKGLNSVYVYSNDSSRQGLLKLAMDAAAAMGSVSRRGNVGIDFVSTPIKNIHTILTMPGSVEVSKKILPLKTLDRIARETSTSISQVMASFIDVEKDVLIANSEGLHVLDNRVRSRIAVQTIAGNGRENQTGYEGEGAHMGFEFLEKKVDLESMAKEAAGTAVAMLGAKYAPAGKMPVIIENGAGGTIFHEACGHSLEATSVAIGLSEMTGRLGQKIASDIVTAYDDGTIVNEYGSQMYDDEGELTRKTTLIENGILKNYMVDRLNSRRMNMPLTGSAKRESYVYPPTSRMTNTFIAAGDSDPEDIIRETPYGLYAKKIGGGSVDPATGEFNFSVNEGYLIKDGVIADPVRGAALIGKGSEILMKIDRVGNNLAHSSGTCGSLSGWVPVTVGQPTIRVSELLVGGKEGSNE